MLAAFVDTLGSYLVLALLPYYALELGASGLEVGLLVAAFAVAQTLTAPLWGRLSDRWGRRPVILIGLAVSAVAFVAFAYADDLWLLLLSRLAQGAGGGTVAVVFAYIADVYPPHLRAERIGWLTAATSGAAMIGPAIGSLAGRFDPTYPGLVAALLSISCLVWAAFWLGEPVVHREVDPSGSSLGTALLAVALHPGRPVNTLIWSYAIAMLASSAMTGVIALFLDERFAITADRIWIFFAVLAGSSLAIRVALLGVLVRRLGEVRVLRLGALFLALGLLAAPLAPSFAFLLAPTVCFALGQSLLYPCTTALVSHHAPRTGEVGQVLGVQQAFGGLSRIVGPVLAGGMFDALGAATPFWLFGVLVAALVVWTHTGPMRAMERGGHGRTPVP
jgi:MFS family permease